MLTRLATPLLALLLVATPEGVQAESFRFDGGRFASGKVLEMQLTPAQIDQVESHFTPGMTIKLNPAQRALVRSAARLKVAPTKITVYRPEDVANECTCGAANYGFPFRHGWLELPLDILYSDRDSAGKRIVD